MIQLFKNKYEVHFGPKKIGDGPVYSFAEAAELALQKLNLIQNHPLHDELAYMDIMIEKWHWFTRIFLPYKSTLIFWSQKEKKFAELTGTGKYVKVKYNPPHKIAA